jgi:hypothetical protein
MEDRAGLTTPTINRPILRLEGLIADTAMAGHIGRQDRPNDLLSDCGTDHLIVPLYYPIPIHRTTQVVTAPEPSGSGECAGAA